MCEDNSRERWIGYLMDLACVCQAPSEGARLEAVRQRDGHEMRTVELRAVAAEGRR